MLLLPLSPFLHYLHHGPEHIGRDLGRDLIYFVFVLVLQETQSPVCVSGLASKKRNEAYGVGSIFFLYNNLSFLSYVCFLTRPRGAELREKQRIISMAFWRNVESIMIVHIVENVYICLLFLYLLIIVPFYRIWAIQRVCFPPTKYVFNDIDNDQPGFSKILKSLLISTFLNEYELIIKRLNMDFNCVGCVCPSKCKYFYSVCYNNWGFFTIIGGNIRQKMYQFKQICLGRVYCKKSTVFDTVIHR